MQFYFYFKWWSNIFRMRDVLKESKIQLKQPHHLVLVDPHIPLLAPVSSTPTGCGSGVGWRESWVGWKEKVCYSGEGCDWDNEKPFWTTVKPQPHHCLLTLTMLQTAGGQKSPHKNESKANRMSVLWAERQTQRLCSNQNKPKHTQVQSYIFFYRLLSLL